MKPAPIRQFIRAATIEEASRALAATEGTAVAIAGGQSLVPMLALRLAPADTLVHLTRIPGLAAIERVAGVTRIGAAVTHAALEDGGASGPAGAFLSRVAAGISYRSVRNHGTIGGSMALADPAADWPVAFLALAAKVHIAGPGGATRTLAVDDFLLGAYTTALSPGEIITALDVPDPPAGVRLGYRKVARKSGAFAMSIGCAMRSAGTATVVLGGTSTRPRILPTTSALLAGSAIPSDEALRAAVIADIAAAGEEADAYQQRLHGATVLAAVKETLG